MKKEDQNQDKAGEEYWSKEWSRLEIPDHRTFTRRTASNYRMWNYHEVLTAAFKGLRTEGLSLLEIGCGNSAFLPYFHDEWGFKISGIDYSQRGCEMSRHILQGASVNGEIHLADMFDPPAELIGRFDVVCSFGVIEHFADTAGAVDAAGQFLKKGGILITTVPNHHGLTGFLQKMFSKEVYAIHEIIDRKRLDDAVKAVSLRTIQSGYFINVSLYANPGIPGKENPFYKIKKLVLKMLSLISKAFWWADLHLLRINPSRSYSAGVYCIAVKDET